jgi:hypothetical protein
VCSASRLAIRATCEVPRSAWHSLDTFSNAGLARFGTIATLLEMVPVASIFFSFTNAVGAALWAADIEAKESQMSQGTAPSLRETAKKAE